MKLHDYHTRTLYDDIFILYSNRIGCLENKSVTHNYKLYYIIEACI